MCNNEKGSKSTLTARQWQKEACSPQAHRTLSFFSFNEIIFHFLTSCVYVLYRFFFENVISGEWKAGAVVDFLTGFLPMLDEGDEWAAEPKYDL